MKWIEMQGPIIPILRIMANYYSKRCYLDPEDLTQEAWLALCRRRGHTVAVAQTAMINAAETSRVQRKYDKIGAELRNDKYHQHFEYLDLPVYLARLDCDNQEIIKMYYLEEKSVKEIAKRCDMSVSGINRRIKIAMVQMRGNDVQVKAINSRYSRSRRKTTTGWKRLSKYYKRG